MKVVTNTSSLKKDTLPRSPDTDDSPFSVKFLSNNREKPVRCADATTGSPQNRWPQYYQNAAVLPEKLNPFAPNVDDEEATLKCDPAETISQLEKTISVDVDLSSARAEEEVTVQCSIEQYEIPCFVEVDNRESQPVRADDEITVQCRLDEEETSLVPKDKTEETVKAYLEEVEFYMQNDLFKDAKELTEDILQKKPNHPILLDKLALIGNSQRVLNSDFPSAPKSNRGPQLESRSDEQMSHQQKGIRHWKNGNTSGAIKEFEAALKSTKKPLFCHKMLAVCYAKKRKISLAIKHFKQGLHCEDISRKDQVAIYFKLGRCYEYLKDGKEALYYYSKVMWHRPDYRDVQHRIRTLEQA